MADDTLSADAMLALANDYDAGVDIDSQPKEQSPSTNETAPVEQDSSDAGSAGKEVDGGEQEVGTKAEPEAKAEKARAMAAELKITVAEALRRIARDGK